MSDFFKCVLNLNWTLNKMRKASYVLQKEGVKRLKKNAGKEAFFAYTGSQKKYKLKEMYENCINTAKKYSVENNIHKLEEIFKEAMESKQKR